ncbi:hypothetical protein HOK51_00690 [Candidatus Woesearchaeota archaeon]|jgi:hypothetical protein|nr:hypothetical protein [Candidatus Woesearchaeota archaeon]MBT6518331.1 hypothetical protein [Candidatus Woesearchaeota archaeon]MBT7366628.1 hypothetical protein [Candidatus Woesearchaeota archaeon]
MADEKKDQTSSETESINNSEKNSKELTLDEIKKLPLQERVKKLKELQDKRKKEEEKIKKEKEETEKLLDESLGEISDKKKEEDEKKEVDESELGDLTGEELSGDDLEDSIKKHKIKLELEQSQVVDYGSVEYLTSPKLYNALDDWQQKANNGTLSSEYEDTIKELYEQVKTEYEAVVHQIETGQGLYQKNEEALDKLIATRKILKEIGYKTNWFDRRGR